MVYIPSQNLYLILGGTDYVPSICFFGTTEALRSLELGLARWRSECQPYIFHGISGIKSSDLMTFKHKN